MMQGTTTVLAAPGAVEQHDFAVPSAEPGGMVLRMVRANVCGSEVHIFKGHHPVVRPGCVLGHEGVGRVAELGDGVSTDFAGTPIAEGDRVVATYFQACRRCPECNRADGNLCRNAYERWGTPAKQAPHFFGTFGTHWSLGDSQYVYRIPDEVSSKAASSANCALSQMVNAVHEGGVGRGDKVVLLGAGGLGLCGAALAREAGAEVFVAEVMPSRLEKARAFGAHHLIDLSAAGGADERVAAVREATGDGADVLIEVAGVPDAFAEGARSVRQGGRMVSIGNVSPDRFTAFDPGLFTRSGVTIRAVIRYPAYFLGRALAFIQDTPRYPWEDLVDADYAFDDARAAIQAAEDREVTRAALIIDEG